MRRGRMTLIVIFWALMTPERCGVCVCVCVCVRADPSLTVLVESIHKTVCAKVRTRGCEGECAHVCGCVSTCAHKCASTAAAGAMSLVPGVFLWRGCCPVPGPSPEDTHLMKSLTTGTHSGSTSMVTLLPGSFHRPWASGLVDRISLWAHMASSSSSLAFTLMNRSQPFWLSKICSRAAGSSPDRSRV